MPLASLEKFPEVCRLCLQPKTDTEGIPLAGTQPEFEATLQELLDDFCFAVPEEYGEMLPSTICESCLDEFLAVYRVKKKMDFLLSFQIAFTRMQLQGMESDLRQLFDQHYDYMLNVFRDINLIHHDDDGDDYRLQWDDLVAANSEPEPKESFLEPSTEEGLEMIDDENNLFEIEVLDEEIDETNELSQSYQKDFGEAGPSSETNLNNIETDPTLPKILFKKHVPNQNEVELLNEPSCPADDCGVELKSQDDLTRHKKESHAYFGCDICGLELKNKYSLEVHIRRHQGTTRYNCEYCASSFHTAQEQKLHLQLVHLGADSVECEICGLAFKNTIGLKRHLKSHSEVRNYKCPHCDKAFKTNMHLHRHKETIHLKVRFNCPYCDISYGRKDKLRMHIERDHDIQSYFICEICVKSFNTNEQLEEHMNHHGNPKPLECGVCLVAFLEQSDFEQHLCISYRDNYECCGQDHKYHTYFNKHMFLKHGERTNFRVKPNPVKLLAKVRAERKHDERCPKCGKVFETRKLKNEHKSLCGGASSDSMIM
ncbi:zinc finger and BTB domain-containing protein 41-like [Uranotaenia lowii]|uniref:zinc finger and BTB domain-containing protein 41-like n=1 Tax=Uranotaenia lowii TaxID=190385 RepID=UPI0024796D0A|nr:zinc finger and BTB domain-containing protein 41-like [Uranotaenia lowii]